MDIIVINGSPASGKTTSQRNLRDSVGGALVDMGRFREMYLDREWTHANEKEAQMAFELACHTAKIFVQNGIVPVTVADLRPEHIRQLSHFLGDWDYGIITLSVRDRTILQERITHPLRDSGFKDLDAAWAWNQAELSRELLPHEVRLDTSFLSPEETLDKSKELIKA